MTRTRTDFTDEQRAELFRLDRATCSYSGRNLWILDYGMDPSYAIDWADHIVPASKGGPSEVENGATASWFHNYLRGDAQNRLYLFYRGQPTADFLWHYGPLPDTICRNLQRFARLHTSDWFLNRGLWHFWLACVTEYQAKLGTKSSRRKEYYTAAATKTFEKWRRRCDRDGVSAIEERGLAPSSPEPDQEMLASARNLSTQAELLELVSSLFDSYAHTEELFNAVANAKVLADLDVARDFEAKNKDIPNRLASRILATIRQLEQILPDTPVSADT